ncbi:sialidase family protein [Pseudomonas sp. TMP9]|uniref:sialidase family protein n=1 Tax=Pseudomonas sp. TMP9 TaxID=3133144 RepID=UPI0030CE79E5
MIKARAVPALLSAAAVVFAFAWYSAPPQPLAAFVPLTSPPLAATEPLFAARFASSNMQDFVHSASITGLTGGNQMAVWFAGTREGSADVQIRAARFDAAKGQWGAERVLATRKGTERAVGKRIRKLGNPVISLAPDNRLWLFYVSVSIGGWAGSAVNAMVSDDLGETWSAPWQLVTSPFLNISTLVRGAPVFHADGSIGLPVYHEFLGKFPEYLHLSKNGQVQGKYRIGKARYSLQPSVVPLDEHRAVALLRYAGETHHRVLASRTEDNGRTWSQPQPLEPSNPNSSVSAVGRPDGSLLVAMNDLEDGRFRLTLYTTDSNLDNWRTLGDLDESPNPWGEPIPQADFPAVIREKFRASGGDRFAEHESLFLERVTARMCTTNGCDFDYEYPYFSRDADGNYHLVYSWNDMFIKHLTFNEAWLAERRP